MMRPADQADKTAASTADGLVGRCHCGGVEFRVPAETDFASAKRCDCSYCRRRWAPNASVAEDRLEILKGRELLSCYGFHTHVAEHFFCSRCGNYTFHRRRIDPSEFGVNVGCFDHISMADYNNTTINDGVNHPSDDQGRRPGQKNRRR